MDNKIVYLQGPKYAFLGLVNAAEPQDPQRISVWAGINTEGLAIMNAVLVGIEREPFLVTVAQ